MIHVNSLTFQENCWLSTTIYEKFTDQLVMGPASEDSFAHQVVIGTYLRVRTHQ